MRIFGRLFGKKSQPSVSDEAIGAVLRSESHALFSKHWGKICDDFKGDRTMSELLVRVAVNFTEKCLIIDKKIEQTREDGRLHSYDGFVEDMLFSVTTIPVPLQMAQGHFAEVTPPGYSEFMNRFLNSALAKVALAKGGRVLAHVVFCVPKDDQALDVHLGLVPMNEKYVRACPHPVVPIDLLSADELARMQ